MIDRSSPEETKPSASSSPSLNHLQQRSLDYMMRQQQSFSVDTQAMMQRHLHLPPFYTANPGLLPNLFPPTYATHVHAPWQPPMYLPTTPSPTGVPVPLADTLQGALPGTQERFSPATSGQKDMMTFPSTTSIESLRHKARQHAATLGYSQ